MGRNRSFSFLLSGTLLLTAGLDSAGARGFGECRGDADCIAMYPAAFLGSWGATSLFRHWDYGLAPSALMGTGLTALTITTFELAKDGLVESDDGGAAGIGAMAFLASYFAYYGIISAKSASSLAKKEDKGPDYAVQVVKTRSKSGLLFSMRF